MADWPQKFCTGCQEIRMIVKKAPNLQEYHKKDECQDSHKKTENETIGSGKKLM